MTTIDHRTLPGKERILTLLPPAEAERAISVLARHGIAAVAVDDIAQLAEAIGDGAEAAFVAAELLDDKAMQRLDDALAQLPEWGGFPLLLLMHEDAAAPALPATLLPANTTFLHRPVRPLPLVSAARAALQARRRQQQLQQYLSRIEEHEQSLRESEERFRVALKNAPIVVASLDRELRFTWIHNSPFTAADQEVIGRRVDELPRLERCTQLPALLQNALDHEQGLREQIAVAADAGERIYDLTVEPVRDDSGAVIGLTCAGLDVTERELRERELQRSEERLELAVSGSASGFWDIQLQPEGRERQVYLSSQQKAMLGVDQGDLAGSLERWHEQVLSEDRPRLRQALRRAWRSGPFEVEYRIRRPDGEIRWLLARGRIERDARGRVNRWIGLDWDITERKRNEEERARLAAVVESSRDAIISITLDGVITGWNAAATQIYGYAAEEMIGQSLARLSPPEAQADTAALLERLQAGEQPDQDETVRVCKNGNRLYVQRTVSPVRDEQGRIVFASSIERDISESKRLQARLRHEAFHDALTGLPNRALFADRVRHVIARAQRQREFYALLVLDLDNFKVINDSLGHLLGDQLLVQFSQRMRECLRPGDTLARLGGDEFGILLENMRDLDGVLQVVERMQKALTDTFHISNHEIKTSTSIGIALSDHGYYGPDTLLRDADTALYQAKARGKNRYVIFDQSMREAAVARMRLENNLRNAIHTGALEVHFQPIVSIGSGRVSGCEALARWNDPELGSVSPAEFIPVAEESGLIMALGELVLEKAARELAGWRRAGLADGLYISVNLSTRQIQQSGLIDQVLQTLHRHGLHGSDLRLEVTESIMMSSGLYAAEVLERLRWHGIGICMDDFGTGYSSLSYLREFPFDVLKIDKSFVQSIAEDNTTREIVRTVTRLAEGLMVEAIAEGVESGEHLETLKAMGLRWAQGFHFSKALRPEHMAALLAQHGSGGQAALRRH